MCSWVLEGGYPCLCGSSPVCVNVAANNWMLIVLTFDWHCGQSCTVVGSRKEDNKRHRQLCITHTPSCRHRGNILWKECVRKLYPWHDLSYIDAGASGARLHGLSSDRANICRGGNKETPGKMANKQLGCGSFGWGFRMHSLLTPSSKMLSRLVCEC